MDVLGPPAVRELDGDVAQQAHGAVTISTDVHRTELLQIQQQHRLARLGVHRRDLCRIGRCGICGVCPHLLRADGVSTTRSGGAVPEVAGDAPVRSGGEATVATVASRGNGAGNANAFSAVIGSGVSAGRIQPGTVPGSADVVGAWNERGVRRARRSEVELQAVRVQPHRRNLDTGDTGGGGVAVAHVRGLGGGQRQAAQGEVEERGVGGGGGLPDRPLEAARGGAGNADLVSRRSVPVLAASVERQRRDQTRGGEPGHRGAGGPRGQVGRFCRCSSDRPRACVPSDRRARRIGR